MYILFWIIDVGFVIYACQGDEWWWYLISVPLIILSAQWVGTSTVQSINYKRGIQIGHIIGGGLAFFALRNLILFIIWYILIICESFYVSKT